MLDRFLREPMNDSSAGDLTMGGLGRSSAELVERYVDGTLDERERRVFEKSLETDAVLREHVALQRRIDASLRGKLGPSDLVLQHIGASIAGADVTTTPSGASRGVALPRKRQVNWLRVAALVAVTVGVYFASTMYMGQRPAPPPARRILPAVAYQSEVDRGMHPYAVCTTSEQFASYTRTELGVALAMRPIEGLTLIGWNYGNVFGPKTTILLAKYHDKPVVIFIDKVDVGPDNTCGGGPNEGSRVLGTLYLHEVRAEGVPSVLEAFEIVK